MENNVEAVPGAPISTALATVHKFGVLKPEDHGFLVEKSEHFCKVFENVHVWRTQWQKESIISDLYHPTPHSKFHQAMLEQKVQIDQLFYLLKDVEFKKLDVEDVEADIEDMENRDLSKKEDIQLRKAYIDRDFKLYELQQMKILVKYRMDEIRGWQDIQERLLEQMRAEGMDEDVIWSKNMGEIESMFFSTLNNLHGIKNSTDGAEANNLVALASFAVNRVRDMGLFENLAQRCNARQLESLEMLGFIKIDRSKPNA